MEENFSFGYWLKRQRLARDLRQADLAGQLGVATVTLRKIEADERRPSLQLAARVAELFALSEEERATLLAVARADATPVALPLPARAAEPAPRPPARAPDTPRHNLPAPLTTLIGRGRQVAELRALLGQAAVRLVTLIGPGGTGKTRLALEAAAELTEQFPDGVWFVNLAPVRDAALVIPTIAQTLDIRERAGRDLAATLGDALREQRLLLLLDNVEQVVAAAPELAALLATAPDITFLVTSREALHLSGEHLVVVPPLSLPGLQTVAGAGAAPPEEASQSEAIQLFVERARAARADFALTSANEAAVAAICVRLDGLPLAIELAAARARLFTPEALLGRLERRLALLTGGPRDAPARQQALRDTITWSYDLLSAEEQRLFSRLGVFAGGWSVAAAAAIDGSDEIKIVDQLAALADKSLLHPVAGPDGEPRFAMLETIREYALEQLERGGELEAARERHAAYFLGLAEMAALELRGPRETVWLDRLEAEHDNLRGALRWAIAERQSERARRLAAALWPFWWRRGYPSEGLPQLEACLALPGAEQDRALRANLLLGASRLAIDMGSYARGRSSVEQSLALWRQLGDQRGAALALWALGQLEGDLSNYAAAQAATEEALALFQASGDSYGVASALAKLVFLVRLQGDYSRARSLAEQTLTLAREIGDLHSIASSYEDLGYLTMESDLEHARVCFTRSLELYQQLGDRQEVASAWNNLGCLELVVGRYAEAQAHLSEGLRLRRMVGDRRGAAATLINLGNLALLQGDGPLGEQHHREVLAAAQLLSSPAGVCLSIEGLAGAAALAGEAGRAALLIGATEALHAAIGLVSDLDCRLVLARTVERTRAGLGEEAYERGVADGRALSLEQTIALAGQPLAWPYTNSKCKMQNAK